MHWNGGLGWCSLLLSLVLYPTANLLCSDRMAEAGSVGLLVMAHGGDPEWNRAVEAAVGPLRNSCLTEVVFGMASPVSLQAGVSRLEARGVRRVGVVGLFVSSQSFRHQTEYVLGLRPDPPQRIFVSYSS